mmetsp:Transcript_6023/g.18152  ORF Transcript_6023/g.18152 Transcript_6023/m.18152 type:complete len:107 (+) Transcript_6023:1744-2064(+)
MCARMKRSNYLRISNISSNMSGCRQRSPRLSICKVQTQREGTHFQRLYGSHSCFFRRQAQVAVTRLTVRIPLACYASIDNVYAPAGNVAEVKSSAAEHSDSSDVFV